MIDCCNARNNKPERSNLVFAAVALTIFAVILFSIDCRDAAAQNTYGKQRK